MSLDKEALKKTIKKNINVPNLPENGPDFGPGAFLQAVKRTAELTQKQALANPTNQTLQEVAQAYAEVVQEIKIPFIKRGPPPRPDI